MRPHRGSSLDDAWRPAPQSAGTADVFAALADPTRRTVLQEVALRGSATATELAAPLAVTRQAVAKHLGVLAQAGLVDARREGRETRYRPTPAPMGEAIGWMAEVGGAWDERLAALERTVERRRISPPGPRSRA